MRAKLTLVVLAILALVTCSGNQQPVPNAGAADKLAIQFPKTPKPATAVFYPPVPLVPPSEGNNLLSDPSFESGLAYWRAEGPDADCYSFNSFSADGQLCCHALGKVFVHQPQVLMPNTLYTFSALVFSVGDSAVTPEARDLAGSSVVKGKTLNGPVKTWQKVSMTFLTNRSEKTAVGINCENNGKNDPVLIDQCALYPIPTANLLETGSAEFVLKDDQTPAWYLNGKAAAPVTSGYKSERAFELPNRQNDISRLYGFVYARDEVWGRDMLINAMEKIDVQKKASAPAVTIGVRLAGTSTEALEQTAACPATGDWQQISLLVKMPPQQKEPDTPLPFPVIVFERPAGLEGNVLIDDVTVCLIPKDGFDGMLASGATVQ